MRESEQFDDLTTSDEQMPPPEKATMSLKDFNRGEEPAFEPIHEDDADRFIREAFENTEDFGDVGDFEQPQSHLYVLRYTIYPSRGEFQPKTKIFKFRSRDTLGALKKTLYKLCYDYDTPTPWKDFLEELPENFGIKEAPHQLRGEIELNNIVFRYNSG